MYNMTLSNGFTLTFLLYCNISPCRKYFLRSVDKLGGRQGLGELDGGSRGNMAIKRDIL
jgi:hypothetical protein